MNKLLIVLFGIVVTVHSFSIPLHRDALSEHSSHVDSLSSDDSPSKDSFVEDSGLGVVPSEDNQSEDQSAGSQPSESSQAEESHQDQPSESSQAEESHQDQPSESSQAEESHSSQSEDSSNASESHSEDKPSESSQAEESHSEDKPSESSQAEESHSEDKPADSSPVEDSNSESHSAENPLANELPEEDLHEENSPVQPELNENKHEDDSSKKEEEKPEEDDDLPDDYYDDEELKSVSNGLYRFSSEFYKKTAATRTRNLICSPLSVGVLLAMTAQGARGVTEKEMRKGLHLPEDTRVSKNGFKSLIDSLNADKKAEVHLANAVFMNDMIEITPEFETITEEYFQSPVEKVPFYYADEASDIINHWVDENTHGKVKNVVKPKDTYDAEMVLVNAVYFKGSWQSKFNHKDTKDKIFNTDNKHYKKVPTMYQKHTFNYGDLPHLDSVYVELPYEHLDEDDEMSMFIVLPKQVNGLRRLINASEKINFQALHNSPRMVSVKLSLPKFKIRSTLNLQPVLENLGMKDMFKHRANFTGITISRHLSLSKVVQKAYLEVNEAGSEAAAATVGILNVLLGSQDHVEDPVVEMHVDHPFMYAIYHKATNTVLFQGHIRVPGLK